MYASRFICFTNDNGFVQGRPVTPHANEQTFNVRGPHNADINPKAMKDILFGDIVECNVWKKEGNLWTIDPISIRKVS